MKVTRLRHPPLHCWSGEGTSPQKGFEWIQEVVMNFFSQKSYFQHKLILDGAPVHRCQTRLLLLHQRRKAVVTSAANNFSPPGASKWCLSAKERKATHLEAASVLGVNLDGSAITRGATETEQAFRLEVCGLEEVVIGPEEEGVELLVMVADTTELPQAEGLLSDAGVSGVVGIFWDPSVTQWWHQVRTQALTCATHVLSMLELYLFCASPHHSDELGGCSPFWISLKVVASWNPGKQEWNEPGST